MNRPDFKKDMTYTDDYGVDMIDVDTAIKVFDEWLSQQTMLYGLHDEDGWHFHEKPGDMDTHTCRAFGFEEING